MPIVASLFGGMQTLIGPMAGALVITGLDEFVFKRFFETGHKLFFGLLLAVVIGMAIRSRRRAVVGGSEQLLGAPSVGGTMAGRVVSMRSRSVAPRAAHRHSTNRRRHLKRARR